MRVRGGGVGQRWWQREVLAEGDDCFGLVVVVAAVAESGRRRWRGMSPIRVGPRWLAVAEAALAGVAPSLIMVGLWWLATAGEEVAVG